MLQQDKPADYVLATGETHTVREFVELAFAEAGEQIIWQGKGIAEKGYSKRTGDLLVDVDARYFRPAEVELLWGNPAKAERKLGWRRDVGFHDLVRLMIKADMAKYGS